MPTVSGPQPEAVTELKISQDGKMRFLVGLSWLPRELPKLDIAVSAPPEDGNTAGKIVYYMMKPFDFVRILFLSTIKLASLGMYAGKTYKNEDMKGRDMNADQFDLDLDCYIFDRNMVLKCVVGTEDDSLMIDPSQKVYHTGDDQSGMGGGDAEQIFIETAGLPEDYHHFFFVTRSDCKYSLDQFNSPSMRLADSKTEKNMLNNSLTPQGGKHYNYVFCHVFRDGAGWKFRNLDIFQGDGINWESFLQSLAAKKAA